MIFSQLLLLPHLIWDTSLFNAHTRCFCGLLQVTAATAVSGSSVTDGGGSITVTGLGFGPVGSTYLQYIFWDNGADGTFQTKYPPDIGATVSVLNTEITFNAPTGTGTVSEISCHSLQF